MMTMSWPALNASLNAASAVGLLLGYACIRRRHIAAHRACMIAASAISLVFFLSYLAYHSRVGSVRFQGQGWIRPVYFLVLISHVVLAVVIVPLVGRTLVLALTQRFDAHRFLARVTFPLWLYVSVTGVVVYLMLYRLG